MSFFNIPAQNDVPWYSFTLSLNEVVYTLTFRYNPRMQRWILDISDSAGEPILRGCVLLIERNLAGQYVMEGLPGGTFFAVDYTNEDTQPTRYSFGVDHGLVYEDGT